MSDFETLSLEHDNGISTVTFRRPDKLNAINGQVLTELHEAAEQLAERDGLQTVLLEGQGRAFIAGADIGAMAEMSPEEGEALCKKGHETMDAIEAIPAPVIAAVDGFALGGGLEVAVACDLIYASGRASFGVPEVTLGIIPGFGGTQRLARVVGWQRARELVLTGDNIDAEQADAIGLTCDVFEVDVFEKRVRDVADTIASRAPLAIRAAKRVMRDGRDLPLDEGLEREREAFGDLFDTEDRVEGMEAFEARRDPDFEGR